MSGVVNSHRTSFASHVRRVPNVPSLVSTGTITNKVSTCVAVVGPSSSPVRRSMSRAQVGHRFSTLFQNPISDCMKTGRYSRFAQRLRVLDAMRTLVTSSKMVHVQLVCDTVLTARRSHSRRSNLTPTPRTQTTKGTTTNDVVPFAHSTNHSRLVFRHVTFCCKFTCVDHSTANRAAATLQLPYCKDVIHARNNDQRQEGRETEPEHN